MTWENSLNQYGLSITPPPSMQTSSQVTTQYGNGTITANTVNGQITNQLLIGNPSGQYIMLDGLNSRITVFDGTNTRVVIGNLK
jgi:hypothetical protein